MTDRLGHAPPHTYLDRARRGFEHSAPSRKVVAGARPIRKSYYVLARSLASRSRSAAARSAKAATFWHRSAESTTFWHEPIRKSCYILARAGPEYAEAATFWHEIGPKTPLSRRGRSAKAATFWHRSAKATTFWHDSIRKSCYVLDQDPQNLLRFGSRSAKAATFWHPDPQKLLRFGSRSARAATFWHETNFDDPPLLPIKQGDRGRCVKQLFCKRRSLEKISLEKLL